MLGAPLGLMISRRLRDRRLNGKTQLEPRRKPAREGPHSINPSPLQEQRHTGAGSFVRSGAKQDDLAVAWDLVMIGIQLFSRKSDRAGYRLR